MVNKRFTVAAIAALMAGTASLASAADLIDPPVVELPDVPIVHPVKAGGWYIRGDVGYSVNDMGDVSYDVFGPTGFGVGLLRGNLSNGYAIGGGVGYDTGHYLRVDLTADYLFSTDFTGNTSCDHDANPATPVTTCTDDTATMSALSLLANAYVDLGTWHGITPYVGAGIGGTQVKWGTLTNDCRTGVSPLSCVDDTHPGGSSWRFTYAAMAGASYDVTDCFAIDAGYRYRKVEGGRMFGIAASGTPGAGHDSGITAHDFRIGARYKFGGGGGHGCGGSAPEPELVEYKPIFK